jgi:hypothetical protein
MGGFAHAAWGPRTWANSIGLRITFNPADVNDAYGAVRVFGCTAVVSSGLLKFEWHKYLAGVDTVLATETNKASGYTSVLLGISVLFANDVSTGCYYYCIVSQGTQSVTSTHARSNVTSYTFNNSQGDFEAQCAGGGYPTITTDFQLWAQDIIGKSQFSTWDYRCRMTYNQGAVEPLPNKSGFASATITVPTGGIHDDAGEGAVVELYFDTTGTYYPFLTHQIGTTGVGVGANHINFDPASFYGQSMKTLTLATYNEARGAGGSPHSVGNSYIAVSGFSLTITYSSI